MQSVGVKLAESNIDAAAAAVNPRELLEEVYGRFFGTGHYRYITINLILNLSRTFIHRQDLY